MSLPRDHSASVLTRSVMRGNVILGSHDLECVSQRLVQSIGTLYYKPRFRETGHPFRYFRIALSFPKAPLYLHTTWEYLYQLL